MIDFKKAIAQQAALEAALAADKKLKNSVIYVDFKAAIDTVIVLHNKLAKARMILSAAKDTGELHMKHVEAFLKD